MNADLGQTSFTNEENDALRERLLAWRGERPWRDVAVLVGIPQGSLTPWAGGKYAGGGDKHYANQDIPAAVHRFLLQQEEQAELNSIIPTVPGFQMTPSAQRTIRTLALGQATGEMVAVHGHPGAGKTACARQYAATHQNCFLVTGAPSNAGAPTMLIAILEAMGEKEPVGTPQRLSNKIRDRVRDANALIIIDDAQHMSAKAIEEVRAIHDATDCGVAFIGQPELIVNLRKYTQFSSRIGLKHSHTTPTLDDIAVLAAAWGVGPGPHLEFLQMVGRKPGGLRAVTKVMRLAMAAANQAKTKLSMADLKDAYAQNYGREDAA